MIIYGNYTKPYLYLIIKHNFGVNLQATGSVSYTHLFAIREDEQIKCDKKAWVRSDALDNIKPAEHCRDMILAPWV